MRKWISLFETRRYTEDELIDMDIDVLDRLAFGYTDGEIIEISPKDIGIKWEGDLENPEYKYELGGDDWVNSVDLSEPVKVSINDNGELQLEDGHHRRFAALRRGVNLKAEIDIQGNPVRAILRRQG